MACPCPDLSVSPHLAPGGAEMEQWLSGSHPEYVILECRQF